MKNKEVQLQQTAEINSEMIKAGKETEWGHNHDGAEEKMLFQYSAWEKDQGKIK